MHGVQHGPSRKDTRGVGLSDAMKPRDGLDWAWILRDKIVLLFEGRTLNQIVQCIKIGVGLAKFPIPFTGPILMNTLH
jgi:hypothetical protein